MTRNHIPLRNHRSPHSKDPQHPADPESAPSSGHHPRPSRQRLSALATLSAAALALTACAGDGGGGGGGGDQEEVVMVHSIGPLPHLNPQFMTSPNVNVASSPLIEPLVKMNNDYEIIPWLARDWETSEDGLETTLYLEEGVEWHDGEPFTSEDVAFNLEEIIEYQRAGVEIAEAIESVDTPDDHTVVIHFSEPYGPFLQGMSLQRMLPKHIYEGTDYVSNPANSEPVGTGPMIFESFVEGESLEVVKNEDYWAGEVHIDRLIFPVLSDPNARDLALLSGELDRSSIESTRFEDVEADPNLEITPYGSMPGQIFFNMNSQVEELSDPEVRQLVFAAVDVETIHETAVPNTGEPAASLYPPGLDWAQSSEVDFLEDFAYDVDAINEGLDEAGYPVGDDGYRFSLELTYMSHLSDVRAIAEIIQASMDEVGIRIDLNGVEDTVYQEYVTQEGGFEAALLYGGTETDPNLGITIWHECNPQDIPFRNPSGLCDDELDQYADQARGSVDEDERGEALQRFEERSAELMTTGPIAHIYALTAFNADKWEGADLPTRNQPIDWHEMKLRD